MLQLGEIRKASEIGYQGYRRYIWSACDGCGKERWVGIFKGKPKSNYCKSCVQKHRRGNKASHWKGGRIVVKGYIMVRIYPEDFFYSMASRSKTHDRYVSEHRLIMAKYLKRCLLPWEIVHHRNGIKDDNRLQNLQLLPSQSYHIVDSHVRQYVRKLEARIEQLEVRVTLLEAENVVLRKVDNVTH